MTTIAVVGANGQVGTELVLRLAHAKDVEVVPIVRNMSGSAFLRMQGIACRHGAITDQSEARALLADADVVVNLAHIESYIARQRRWNGEIQRTITESAPTAARVVFTSTIMVYAPNLALRIPDSYGAEKFLLERQARRWARKYRKELVILRLGHVLGDLQNISENIVRQAETGLVALPAAGGLPSNTVFLASLAEALVAVGEGTVFAGTYDLVNDPQLTWREVYEIHAKQAGTPLRIVEGTPVPSLTSTCIQATTRVLLHQRVRERLAFFMRMLPEGANERLYAAYQVRRARSEISSLQILPPSAVEAWRGVGRHPLRLGPFTESLKRFPLPSNLSDL